MSKYSLPFKKTDYYCNKNSNNYMSKINNESNSWQAVFALFIEPDCGQDGYKVHWIPPGKGIILTI